MTFRLGIKDILGGGSDDDDAFLRPRSISDGFNNASGAAPTPKAPPLTRQQMVEEALKAPTDNRRKGGKFRKPGTNGKGNS